MRIETLSVFPEMFETVMATSILGRARDKGALEYVGHDLRTWTHDNHRTVDDEIYGGGPGQLMKPEPVFEALDELLATEPAKVIIFTPQGKTFDQAMAQELALEQRLIMICGRYEGFDERVYTLADACISLGDYILTGGELAAMVVSDAICRLLPGVLGDEQSNADESFSEGLLEYPQYTRPASYRGMEVPEVLLSGNHAAIAKWRREMSIIKTTELRPDLLSEELRIKNEE
ncbi:MAG: tRNA (guanosine(37)-N1)-methyltransferase TrmD [Coriobacteriia bacterium]|nr:tRNA (guanosine(37)-N1)-methyltransferase TrmD [Coriobacteriia bacterium]MCL2750005.1 tRNA (guanosine(37)-N1)-methyltransferase TrmD [Coriobacteriia bacterium]